MTEIRRQKDRIEKIEDFRDKVIHIYLEKWKTARIVNSSLFYYTILNKQ